MKSPEVMGVLVLLLIMIFSYSPLVDLIIANAVLPTATAIDTLLVVLFPLLWGALIISIAGLTFYKVLQP